MIKKTNRFIVNKPIKKRKSSGASASSKANTANTLNKPRWVQLGLFPNLTNINQIFTFTFCLILLGLAPGVFSVLPNPPINQDYMEINPDNSDVLGETSPTIITNPIPDYPIWKLTFYSVNIEPSEATAAFEPLEIDLSASEIDAENITFETQIMVSESESYRFNLVTDSASRVYVDGMLLMTRELATEDQLETELTLEPGTHQIQVSQAMPSKILKFEFNPIE